MVKRRAMKKVFGSFLQKKGLVFGVAKTVAGPIAFIDQITAKHRENNSNFDALSNIRKLKTMANYITGSVSGINFFSGEDKVTEVIIKPENIINKWSTGGVAMIGYGLAARIINKKVGSNILPVGGKIKSIGQQLLIGGATAGIFGNKESTTAINPSGLITGNIQHTVSYSNNGNDSTSPGL